MTTTPPWNAGAAGLDVPFPVIADSAPTMLWITDAENRCTFLNRRWEEFTGQTAEEGLGFGWLEAVHPEDRGEAERSFLQAAAEHRSFSLDHRIRTRDGEYRWVIDSGRPRFSDDGEWLGYIGSVTDVHEQRLAMEELRRTEARYRALFEAIDEGFCVIQVLFDEHGRSADYRFVEANPAFVRHTGLEDAIGRTARELLPDLEDHWFEIYGEVARTGEARRFESGSKVMGRWFDVFAFRIGEPEAALVALLFNDVTERKCAEKALREAKRSAEAASQAKSQFLAVMSHELRTPMTGVIAFADLLEAEVYGPVNDEQRKAVERIKANTWHLVGMIDEILSLSRTETGREEVRPEPADLAAIVRDAVRVVEPESARRRLPLRVLGAADPLPVRTDPGKVRQILVNLVGNAVKYTREGEVSVVLDRGDPERPAVHVRDTGPGIAPEDRDRIFEPFMQVDSSLTRTAGGTGLGLAITRNLARLLGGDIELESVRGEGSTFTLRLPREVAEGT